MQKKRDGRFTFGFLKALGVPLPVASRCYSPGMSWYSFVFVAKWKLNGSVHRISTFFDRRSPSRSGLPGLMDQMAGVQAKQRSLHTQEVFAKQMRNNLNLMSLESCMCTFAQVFADRLHFVLCCAMLRCVSLPFQSKRAQSPLVGSPQLLGLGSHAQTLRPCGLLRDDTSMAWCPPFRLWYRCKCDSDTMWHR